MGSQSVLYNSKGNLKRKFIFNQRRAKAGSIRLCLFVYFNRNIFSQLYPVESPTIYGGDEEKTFISY
jgi:hypothetical protein